MSENLPLAFGLINDFIYSSRKQKIPELREGLKKKLKLFNAIKLLIFKELYLNITSAIFKYIQNSLFAVKPREKDAAVLAGKQFFDLLRGLGDEGFDHFRDL